MAATPNHTYLSIEDRAYRLVGDVHHGQLQGPRLRSGFTFGEGHHTFLVYAAGEHGLDIELVRVERARVLRLRDPAINENWGLYVTLNR